ncbi:MAG: hydroxymyristoyl-ACP dehydratase, partial [Candidatus Eremiobacteraeota bacterium]|nr:hydroxymyristoyl-ACP dehydratase [Candidatus Eremiobacteraeota bacterium]
FELPRLAPLDPEDSNTVAGEMMPGGALLMMDRVDAYLPEGGPKGLGFIRGSKTVNPDEWFFKAHFYQDPVWPGSLGLEAFLQLLKVVALDRWPQYRGSHRFEPIAVGDPHTWVYRGQVIPPNKKVVVEAYISHSSEHPHPLLKADGFLVVDGLTIYEMKDFSIRLVPT